MFWLSDQFCCLSPSSVSDIPANGFGTSTCFDLFIYPFIYVVGYLLIYLFFNSLLDEMAMNGLWVLER